MVAQGALNQIVGQVFSRVRPDPKLATRANGPSMPSSPRPNASRSNSSSQIPTSRAENSDASRAQEGETVVIDEKIAEQQTGGEEAQHAVEDSARKNSRTSTETIRPAAPEAVAAGEDSESQAQQAEPADIPDVVGPETSTAFASTAENVEAASGKPEKLSLANIESEAVATGIDPTGQARDGMRTPAPDAPQTFYSLNELHTKDAYLVFRALCKLGMKPLGVERYIAPIQNLCSELTGMI